MVKNMASFKQEAQNRSMTLNNEISKNSDLLKSIEVEKNQLASENEENASRKTQQTTEEGQIIMTINNIYKTLSARVVESLIISSGSGKDSKEDDKPKPAENFDALDKSESMAKLQLEFIRDKLDALKDLVKEIAPDVSKPLRLKL